MPFRYGIDVNPGWLADKANKPRMTALILFVAAGAMFPLILVARSGCSCSRFFAAVETTFPSVGPWSAICSAGSITPRFAGIWSCSTHEEEFSVR